MQCLWQYESVPGDPWTNMAVDAALLSALVDGREVLPTIRIYQWDRPSVSIGRLQNFTAVAQTYPDLPWVRRPTGGRAVLHGSDLTITIATRGEWLPGRTGQGTLPSYRLIMAGLQQALLQCGVPTGFGSVRDHRKITRAVNCFEITAGCDLVDSRTGLKIAGSAQRREQNAILQQNSLPLELFPDMKGFLEQLRIGFENALSIDEWRVI